MKLKHVLNGFVLAAMVWLPSAGTAAPASQVAGAEAVKSIAANQGRVRVIARLAGTGAPARELAATTLAPAHAQVESVMRAAKVHYMQRIPNLSLTVLEVDQAQLQTLLDSGLVESVHEDRIASTQLAESVPLVRGPQGWNLGARGAGQAVVIVDSGVDTTHPFLNPRVVAEACFSSDSPANNASTFCPGGQTSQFGPGAGAPCTVAGCDHGTHVAGIAAGRGSDFSGVAPDADIIAIQVFSRFEDRAGGPTPCADSGRSSPCALAFESDQIRALQHVISLASGFHITSINMSLGGGRSMTACDTEPLKATIDDLRNVGIATVIAAGNSGFTDSVSYPACISTAVTVSSTTKVDDVSAFSNSAAMTDFFAPGSAINSSVPGGAFAVKSGTSMATPHVTGAFAAVRSALPGATLDEVQAMLASTGRQITDARNGLAHPRIVVGSAVGRLAGFRQHGNLIQSTWGAWGNFELVIPQGTGINHYIRDNDDAALPWKLVRTLSYQTLPGQLGPMPKSASMIQSTFRGDGKHGNYELIARVKPAVATQPDHLDFWFLESNTGNWTGPFPLIADGQRVSGVTGDPVLIQSTWGAQGNFELLVPQGDVINHYIRDNDDPQLPWHLVRTLSYKTPANQLGPKPVSVTMIQSTFFGDGRHGNYELIVRMKPAIASQPHYLDYWYFDSSTGNWNGPFAFNVNGALVSGVTGDPQLIQGTWGTRGNFELLVPQGATINHYFRDNDDPGLAWHLIRTVPYGVSSGSFGPRPRDVAFIQSTFSSDGTQGNFELVTHVTPPAIINGPDYLDFWYFDSLAGNWTGPFAMSADGQPITRVTGF
jgi:subtilisin family serine protease